MLPGLLRQDSKRGGIVIGEVLDIGVAEQKLGKGPGSLAELHAARCIADQGCPGFIVTPRHNVLHLPCVRPQPRSSALECISSSAIAWTAIEFEILGLKASTGPRTILRSQRERRTLL